MRLHLRIATITLAAALISTPALAQGCNNKLIGDGLAAGLYKAGLAKRFFLVSVTSRGIEWFKAQVKSGRWYCTDTLIVLLGTYDLPSIVTEQDAQQYASAMVAAIASWHPRQAVWILPGCFDESLRPGLDAASSLLDGVLQKVPAPDYISAFRTRQHFCIPPKADGLHYTPDDYASLWYTLGTTMVIR